MNGIVRRETMWVAGRSFLVMPAMLSMPVESGAAESATQDIILALMLFPDAGFEVIDRPTAEPSTFYFKLAAHSRCFDGHFDGDPILPGVAHLALALAAYAQQGEGRGRVLLGVRDVRFRRKLLPSETVAVALTNGRAPDSIKFEIRCGEELATAGLLVFAPHEAAP